MRELRRGSSGGRRGAGGRSSAPSSPFPIFFRGRRCCRGGWLVRTIPRLRILDLIVQFLLPVRDTVREDDADGRVQVEPALGRAADVEVDEVPESGLILVGVVRNWGLGPVGFLRQRHVDDGPSRVAPLADEGFCPWFHAVEVVWNQEELDCRLVWVLDDDL